MRRFSIGILFATLVVFFALVPAIGQTDKTTEYAVLLDNTRSMEKQSPQVVLLAKALINRIHEQGPVSLFSFIYELDESSLVIPHGGIYEGGNYDRARGTLGIEGSRDDRALNQYVGSLSVARGQTDLLGAIRSMIEFLNAKSNNTLTSKVMILITDGDHRMEMVGRVQPDDTNDERRKRESQVIKLLKESGISVYAIGLTRELDAGDSHFGLSTRDKAESFLNRITKETGGHVVFAKSKKVEPDILVGELFGK